MTDGQLHAALTSRNLSIHGDRHILNARLRTNDLCTCKNIYGIKRIGLLGHFQDKSNEKINIL